MNYVVVFPKPDFYFYYLMWKIIVNVMEVEFLYNYLSSFGRTINHNNNQKKRNNQQFNLSFEQSQ